MCDDLLTFNEIYFLINFAKNNNYKGIRALALSTGMDFNEISKLTVGDFLKSCNEYIGTDYGSVKNGLKKLLKKNLWEIFPCWRLVDEDNVKIVFSTPETVFYILFSLNDRNINELKRSHTLFYNTNSANQYPPESIRDNILRVKDDLFNIDINAQRIKDNFFNICEKYLEVEETIGSKEDLINLFKGESDVNNPFDSIHNQNTVKEYYMNLAPYFSYLSLISFSDVSDLNTFDLRISEQDINEYYLDNVGQISDDYDKYYVVKNWVQDYLGSNDSLIGDLTSSEIKILFKKAQVHYLIENNGILVIDCFRDEFDDKWDQIYSKLEGLGIRSIFGDEYYLGLSSDLANYILGTCYNPYDEYIYAVSSDIEAGLFYLLDS